MREFISKTEAVLNERNPVNLLILENETSFEIEYNITSYKGSSVLLILVNNDNEQLRKDKET